MRLFLGRTLLIGCSWVMLCAATPVAYDWQADLKRLGLESPDIQIGFAVVIEGKGVVMSWAPSVPRAAASAIKTAVALDLLSSHAQNMDDVVQGSESLLQPGTHPAMSGFTREGLVHCRAELTGKTYRDLLRIMMGRTANSNDVYNAACNLIMIKLGGPASITRRLHTLDPALSGIVLDRYMEQWNGDGDNRATPEALVSLYRMTASGAVPGVDPESLAELRNLLRRDEETTGVFEKEGTLFPRPMVRVRAGYVEDPRGRLVYAVMGEVPDPGQPASSELFLRLMRGVDDMAAECRRLARTR